MATDVRTFRQLADTQVTSATQTNTNLTLNNVMGSRSVRVYNAGANTIFLEFQGSGVATTTEGIPMPAGGIEVFTVGQDITNVGIICATGETATVYTTVGEGL
jgi:hypothetical protein